MSSPPLSLSTEGTLPSALSLSSSWLSAPQLGCLFLSPSHNGFSPAPQDSDPIHEHRVSVLGPHFLLSIQSYCISPCISPNFRFYELNLSSQVVFIVLLLVFGFGWGLRLVNLFIELTSLIHSLSYYYRALYWSIFSMIKQLCVSYINPSSLQPMALSVLIDLVYYYFIKGFLLLSS